MKHISHFLEEALRDLFAKAEESPRTGQKDAAGLNDKSEDLIAEAEVSNQASEIA